MRRTIVPWESAGAADDAAEHPDCRWDHHLGSDYRCSDHRAAARLRRQVLTSRAALLAAAVFRQRAAVQPREACHQGSPAAHRHQERADPLAVRQEPAALHQRWPWPAANHYRRNLTTQDRTAAIQNKRPNA
jgi:hypothetical protein